MIMILELLLSSLLEGLKIIIGSLKPSAKLIEVTSQSYEKTMESVILGGIIGIDIAIAIAFISTNTIEFLLRLSLFAFAIAIPLLAMGILLNQVIWKAGYQASALINYNIIKIIGVLSSFIGIVATFWHIFWLIGMTFLISGFISTGIFFIYIGSLDRELRSKDKKVVFEKDGIILEIITPYFSSQIRKEILKKDGAIIEIGTPNNSSLESKLVFFERYKQFLGDENFHYFFEEYKKYWEEEHLKASQTQ